MYLVIQIKQKIVNFSIVNIKEFKYKTIYDL